MDPAPPQNNQDNAWRRKFEDAEKENKALKEAEQKRKDAELSELEREKKRADDATAEAATAKAEALRLRIANEKGVPKEAVALLTGADEATLTAQADAIIALKGNAPPAPAPPVRGGTQTNPGTTPPAGIDERITAAYKSGHNTEAIRLKRVKAGLGVAET